MKLSKEARKQFIKQGYIGGKKLLKEKGLEHFRKMGIISAKVRKEKKLINTPIDNPPVGGIIESSS